MKRSMKNKKALFLLWGLILVSCLIVFWKFIFGNELAVFQDIGSDTLQQYLMHYSSIAKRIREGNLSLWDFTNGFGTSSYTMNLFHPLLMALYLLGALLGPDLLPHLLVYFEILEIFLAATAMFCYLREFKLSDPVRVIAAYTYGFNGFLLVWGQHYQFGLFAILLPLLLMLSERAFARKRFSFTLSLGVFLTVLSSVYMAYMTLLTLGLYLLFRAISLEDKAVMRAKLFFLNCGSILLGLLMAMAAFLPSALYLMNTSTRMDNDLSLLYRFFWNTKPFDFPFYKTAFYRLFSSNLCGVSQNYFGYVNYYEAPVLFCGLLFVILFFQYLFGIHRQETSRKNKLLQYAAVILWAYFIFIQSGSMVFNAFVSAFSRHTFAAMPFAALLTAFTLEDILRTRRLSLPALLLSALPFAALLLRNHSVPQASVTVICILGFLMMAVLLVACRRPQALSATLVCALLLIPVAANMVYDSYHDYNNRNTLTKDDENYEKLLYGTDVTAVLDYLKETDTSFYRVEKDFEAASYCLDSMAQGYYGVSTYNSASNKYVTEFVNTLWPGLMRYTPSMYSYRQAVYDAELLSLMNVKYLLSLNPALDVDGFLLEKQFGSIYLYRNTETESIGKFYTQTVSSAKVAKRITSLDTDRLVTEALIVDGKGNAKKGFLRPYKLEKLDYSIEKKKFSMSSGFTIPVDMEQLKGYDRVYADFTITLDPVSIATVSLNDAAIRHVSPAEGEKDAHVRIRIPLKSCTGITIQPYTCEKNLKISGTVSRIRFYGAKDAPAAKDHAEITFLAPEKETQISGSVKTEADGTLLLTIPYEDGWTALVDGKETEMIRADYGFIGLDLAAGEHEITLRYRAPGLLPGIALSLLGWAFFAVGWILQKRKQR